MWVFLDGTNSDRLEKKIHNIRIKWHWSNGNNMHKQGKRKKSNQTTKKRWKKATPREMSKHWRQFKTRETIQIMHKRMSTYAGCACKAKYVCSMHGVCCKKYKWRQPDKKYKVRHKMENSFDYRSLCIIIPNGNSLQLSSSSASSLSFSPVQSLCVFLHLGSVA